MSFREKRKGGSRFKIQIFVVPRGVVRGLTNQTGKAHSQTKTKRLPHLRATKLEGYPQRSEGRVEPGRLYCEKGLYNRFHHLDVLTCSYL